MIRKVNKVGKSTLTVSLPRNWTKKYKIKQGDELKAMEIDQGILFSSQSLKEKKKKTEIFFKKQDKRHIKSWISRLYRNGYTNISFKVEDPELLQDIKEGLQVCMGAELDDFSENKGSIQVFSSKESADYEKYLVRTIISYKAMVQQLQQDMKNKKFTNYETLNEYRKNGWKYREYITRQCIINKEPQERMMPLIIFTYFFEKIGRSISRFYRVFLMEKKKINISDMQEEYTKLLIELFDNLNKFVSKECSKEQENQHREKIKTAQKNILFAQEKNPDNYAFLTEMYNVLDYLDSSSSSIFLYKREILDEKNDFFPDN